MPPSTSQRSSPPPAQWPLRRSRPKVVASGDPHGYQGGVLSRRPHPLRGVVCADEGFGIEMVLALDKPHAVDILQALRPGAVAEPVPVGLDGCPRAAHGQ